MRSLYVVALLTVAACSSSEAFEVTDAGVDATPDARQDAGVAVYRDAAIPDATEAAAPVDAGPLDPLCDGDKFRDRCAALNLPAEYGVEPACESTPYRGTTRRPDGLAGCVDWETLATGERITCCPK